MRRGVLLGFLAVAGAAALAWAIPRGRPSPRPESEGLGNVVEPAGTVSVAPGAPGLSGGGDDVAKAGAARVEVAGTVRRRDGSPAPFALVALLGPPDAGTEERAILVRTTAGSDGAYLLRLSSRPHDFAPSAAHVVAASRDGKERSRPRPLDAARAVAGAAPRLDVVLVGTGVVQGRVLESKGSKTDRLPIPDASYRLQVLTAEDGLRWGPPTRVAADGSFRVEGLLGDVGLTVEAPGFVPQGRRDYVDPGEASDLTSVLWRTQGGGRGVVRFVDPDGRPVPDVLVRVALPELTPDRSVGRTDAAGEVPIDGSGKGSSFLLRPVLDGTPWVLDPEVPAWDAKIPVTQGDLATPTVIRLFPAAHVSGTVRTASGLPVGPGFPVAFGSRPAKRAFTDEAGRFRLEAPLASGEWPVDLVTREKSVDLAAGDNVLRFEVDDVVGFDLRAVDPASGESWTGDVGGEESWPPFGEWQAHAVPDDGRPEGWIDLVPDPETGRLRGWGVPMADVGYAFRLGIGGRVRFESIVALPRLPGVGRSLRADVAIALDGYGRMRASIRESISGARPSGCQVSVGEVQGTASWRVFGLHLVERGEFLAGPIRAGRYEITFEGFDGGQAARTIDIVSGKTTDLGEVVLGAAAPR